MPGPLPRGGGARHGVPGRMRPKRACRKARIPGFDGVVVMMEFSTWDILRNLLLAARWTIVLSLVAFVCGGALGLFLLFIRTSAVAALRRSAWHYILLFLLPHLLMQLFIVIFISTFPVVYVYAMHAAGSTLS